MIVGTAGHIDHGKTALVQALTGVNTDRLPEEKKRGITIELGYAHLQLPQGPTVSFVDVPGHEKWVRTMIAGASGMDCALILVAADDGLMPQTLEHAAIVSLLGIARGAVVITKIDKVSPAQVTAREQEVRQWLDACGLSPFSVFAVSAFEGTGLSELQQWLAEQALALGEGAERAQPHYGFRMGLDRVFTLDGIGTVVAGSIQAGQVAIGDVLCLAHDPGRSHRVRSLHRHQQSVTQAQAGQRCAIGLVGLERSAVERGMSLCHARLAQMRVRIDGWLTVLPSETKFLRTGTLVHVHAGTQEVMATVAVLGQTGLAPGESGWVQLVVQAPGTVVTTTGSHGLAAAQAGLAVCWGDRLILRDASAQRTVGGVQVLDPNGPIRYRQTPARLAQLQALQNPKPLERLQQALEQAPEGLLAPTWLQSQGWVDWPVSLDEWPHVFHEPRLQWLVLDRHLQAMQQRVLNALKDFHSQAPQDLGPDARRVRNVAAPRMALDLWAALLAHLQAQGRVLLRNGFLCLPEHGEQLRQADLVVAQRVLPLLLAGRFEPPWVRDMVNPTRLSEMQIRSVLVRLAKSAEVYQIVKDLFYHPQVVHDLAHLALRLCEREGHVSAASYRDATGLGRKRAIQILEFFDRVGFLRRVGDLHLIRPGTVLFQNPPSRGQT